ncbi:MAG: hypothetical protein ACOYLC_01785 [Armatimonadaceae bacterium]
MNTTGIDVQAVSRSYRRTSTTVHALMDITLFFALGALVWKIGVRAYTSTGS